MIIRKRVLSLILCAALLICALPVCASAESDFPTVLAEAKKGVVQLYCLGEFPDSWTGTGFAVGEPGKDSDIFLTNWHVATGDGVYSQKAVKIWILQENCGIDAVTLEPDPEKSIVCEILKTTNGAPDYAILRAAEPVEGYRPLALLSGDQVPDGQTVYALGYPGVVDNISISHSGIDDITATNGIVSQHMVDTRNVQVLMHTAQISAGNSGGPLITEDGAVVGVNTYGFGESEADMSRYCAEYIDYAIEGLDALGLPYALYKGQGTGTPAEGKDQQKTARPTNLLPLILLGAAVIVAAVVILLIAMKNKKKREEEERRQEEERRLEAERLRQEDEQRRAQEEARRRDQKVKAKLQMEGGTLYSVRASGCTIGRGTDCTIVLPAKAPGVSTHHCKLEFQGDKLILTDLNSSYGTYIHGKRIPANTPVSLKPGSSFCLGSEQYKFTVC